MDDLEVMEGYEQEELEHAGVDLTITLISGSVGLQHERKCCCCCLVLDKHPVPSIIVPTETQIIITHNPNPNPKHNVATIALT